MGNIIIQGNFMADLEQQITSTIAKTLEGTPLAGAKIHIDTQYRTSKTSNAMSDGFYVDGSNGVPVFTLYIEVSDPKIKFDRQSPEHLRQSLSQLAALAPYVKFDDTPPLNKITGLDKEFHELQALAPDQIPAVLGEAFERRVKDMQKNKSADYDDLDPALSVSRTDTQVEGSFRIPKEMNPDEIEKLLEANKVKILEFMNSYLKRKHPQFADKVYDLDLTIETSSHGNGNWKNVNLTFRSKEVMEALKKDGGLAALSAEEHEKLKATNPLMALKDDKSHELQKALARSIFQSVPEVLAKAGNPPDLYAAISKPLLKLKAKEGTSPDVIAKIDKFLGNDFFKSREQIYAAKEKGVFEPKPLHINKLPEDIEHKKPSTLSAVIQIPEDKWDEVMAQLASGQHAAAAVDDSVTALEKAAQESLTASTANLAAAGVIMEKPAATEGINATLAGAGGITTPDINAAAAGAAAVCPHDKVAVAAAGAACVDKEPTPPAAEKRAKRVVGNINGTDITNDNVESFLARIGVPAPSGNVGPVAAFGAAAAASPNVSMGS